MDGSGGTRPPGNVVMGAAFLALPPLERKGFSFLVAPSHYVANDKSPVIRRQLLEVRVGRWLVGKRKAHWPWRILDVDHEKEEWKG